MISEAVEAGGAVPLPSSSFSPFHGVGLCDAVIMIEHLNIQEDGTIEIEAPAFPWQHVRKMGEDIVATELLFPRSHTVTPYCVGALVSGLACSSVANNSRLTPRWVHSHTRRRGCDRTGKW